MGADLKLLLDTSTLIWITRTPGRVAPAARAALDEPSNTLLISAASAWEIATEHRLGRLDQAQPLVEDWSGQLERFRFEVVSITADTPSRRWLRGNPCRPVRPGDRRPSRARADDGRRQRPGIDLFPVQRMW